MQQLKCFASVDYIAEAGPGLVLGYVLTQWEFAPVGDLGATGATGVLREHARHLCECLVQGWCHIKKEGWRWFRECSTLCAGFPERPGPRVAALCAGAISTVRTHRFRPELPLSPLLGEGPRCSQ